jgi:hypothetical protein
LLIEGGTGRVGLDKETCGHRVVRKELAPLHSSRKGDLTHVG